MSWVTQLLVVLIGFAAGSALLRWGMWLSLIHI
mgnify:CR=1 FL=1